MTGPPRSQRLIGFRSTVAGQNSPVWTTPQSAVTIVKSIYVSNQNAAAGNALLQIGIQGQWVFALERPNIASGVTWVFDGWFVLNPGDQVYVFVSLTDMFVWVSGSVLAGAPSYPPAATLLPALEPHS